MDVRTVTSPAGPDRANEDAVAVAPDGSAAVLVDGAGLPRALRGGCGHEVDWYARTLAQAMLTRCAEATTLTAALSGAISDALAAHGPRCDPAAGSPSSTLASWRIRADRLEWVVLADSSLFLRAPGGAVREVVDTRVDDIAGSARDVAYAELVAAGLQPGAAHLEAHRRTTERLRNVPGGFWCCHTAPEAAQEALTGDVGLRDVDTVVLASDGAARLVRPYGELTAERFVARCAEIGDDGSAGGLVALVTDLRAADVRHRGGAVAGAAPVKVHDDATIVVARP